MGFQKRLQRQLEEEGDREAGVYDRACIYSSSVLTRFDTLNGRFKAERETLQTVHIAAGFYFVMGRGSPY